GLCLLVGVGHVAMAVDADRLHRFAKLLERLEIEVDKRSKSRRRAADDGKHEREVVLRGAYNRFGAAADADPGLEFSVFDWRKTALVAERRPQLALPGHALLGGQRCEQAEFFLKQLLVLVEIKAKQRKGFDERAAPKDDFGTSI